MKEPNMTAEVPLWLVTSNDLRRWLVPAINQRAAGAAVRAEVYWSNPRKWSGTNLFDSLKLYAQPAKQSDVDDFDDLPSWADHLKQVAAELSEDQGVLL